MNLFEENIKKLQSSRAAIVCSKAKKITLLFATGLNKKCLFAATFGVILAANEVEGNKYRTK